MKFKVSTLVGLGFVIFLNANCIFLADTSDIQRRYSDSELAFRRPYLLTGDQITEIAIEKSEPKIQSIETIEQFRAHLELKRAQYKSLLQKVEQRQANDREGTEEKFQAERAKGAPDYDGIPTYVFYEKDKTYLHQKIKNVEAELGILESCSAHAQFHRPYVSAVATVPVDFKNDFIIACDNYIRAVSRIKQRKGWSNDPGSVPLLQLVLTQFDALKSKHTAFKNFSWTNPEDRALQKMIDAIRYIVLGVIDLLDGRFTVRAINRDAEKFLRSVSPGKALAGFMQDTINEVTRIRGRFMPMLDEVTSIVTGPYLGM